MAENDAIATIVVVSQPNGQSDDSTVGIALFSIASVKFGTILLAEVLQMGLSASNFVKFLKIDVLKAQPSRAGLSAAKKRRANASGVPE